MADEKLSQLPTGTAIVDADLSYWDQSASSVSQPASAISTYANSKLPVGSAAQKGIVEVDGTTITASSGVITAVQPTGANPTGTAGPAAVNGTATTFMRSDAAPAIQKASASVFGIVEVDNTTITAAAGVITAALRTAANPSATAGPAAVNGSAATYMRSDAAPAVQKASNTQFGIVEVDNTTITASLGVISAVQPTGANPSATASDTAVNGSATTFMRSDAAPAVQKTSATVFGLAKVDGTSITAVGGVISSTGGGGTPGGANTDVQFNNSSAFGGDSGFTYAGSGQATLALGTITTNLKALSITGTWNAVGTTFDAPLFMNITNTASAAGSLLIDLQVGGSSAFSVDKTGNVFLVGNTGTFDTTLTAGNSNNLSIIAGGQTYQFGNGITIQANSQPLTLHFSGGNNNTYPMIYAETAGSVGIGNNGASSPMALRVYNATDGLAAPTNYERGIFDWLATSNTLTIGTQAGGTGTLRGVSIVGNSLKMGSSGMFTANGAVATVLGSLGPTGASTTVTKWLTIIDNGGTTRYIPCF